MLVESPVTSSLETALRNELFAGNRATSVAAFAVESCPMTAKPSTIPTTPMKARIATSFLRMTTVARPDGPAQACVDGANPNAMSSVLQGMRQSRVRPLFLREWPALQKAACPHPHLSRKREREKRIRVGAGGRRRITVPSAWAAAHQPNPALVLLNPSDHRLGRRQRALAVAGVGAAIEVCDTYVDTETREWAGRVPPRPKEMS